MAQGGRFEDRGVAESQRIAHSSMLSATAEAFFSESFQTVCYSIVVSAPRVVAVLLQAFSAFFCSKLDCTHPSFGYSHVCRVSCLVLALNTFYFTKIDGCVSSFVASLRASP